MQEQLIPKICPKCGSIIQPEAPGGLCPKCLLAFVAQSTGGPDIVASDRDVPDLETIRRAFPQLVVEGLIGQGGMGAVYKARQPKLDRLVAIKVLPQRLAREPAFAERFQREGRLLARLNHPNIVGVYDFGEADGLYYLIMEYVDGVNLRQALATERFTPEHALSIIPKICDALQFAHEEGVLHRDIKPENILLDSKGRVKIADFGIAKFAGIDERTGLTAAGTRLGTPHYMAPEQVERPADVDHRADIFSLGVVFYEMLTGELPLGRFAPPSERSPADIRIDEVVLRALEKDRERRQQSASEVRTQVESLSRVANLQPPRTDSTAATSAQRDTTSTDLRPSLLLSLAAFALIVASVPAPLFACLALPSLTPRDIAIVAFLGTWFGLPGTILAWSNLSAIRRTGLRHGLAFALFSAIFWPAVIVSGGIFAGMVAVLFRYDRMIRPSDYPLLIMPVAIFCVVLTLAMIHALKKRTLHGTVGAVLPPARTPVSFRRIAGYAAALIAWASLGLATVAFAAMSRTTIPDKALASTTRYASVIAIPWEILSVDVKENVVILEVKWTDPGGVSMYINYDGKKLSPAAVELAERVGLKKCYFPGEEYPQAVLRPVDTHADKLAFALPDHEMALACRRMIERGPKKRNTDGEEIMRFFTIQSDAHGEYRATGILQGVRRPSSRSTLAPLSERTYGNQYRTRP